VPGGECGPDLFLVVFEQLRSLEAHLGCDEVVVDAEGLGLKVSRLGELKALQTRLTACSKVDGTTHSQA
jgi:hypothetical protein